MQFSTLILEQVSLSPAICSSCVPLVVRDQVREGGVHIRPVIEKREKNEMLDDGAHGERERDWQKCERLEKDSTGKEEKSEKKEFVCRVS